MPRLKALDEGRPALLSQVQKGGHEEMLLGRAINAFYTHINSAPCSRFQVLRFNLLLLVEHGLTGVQTQISGQGVSWRSRNDVILNNATGHVP